jgi:putative IMPACT (imprinted ancient) family translation regulator
MPADPAQILELKRLLKDFTDATGLKINYHKSYLLPINISEDKYNELAALFGCKKESMPFTYL